MVYSAKPPTGETTISRQELLALHAELARLRLTVEMLGSGIGGLLERGVVPQAVSRARLVELWWLAQGARKALGSGSPEVATTVENIFARHPERASGG